MSEPVSISIKLANRSYKIKVPAEHEEHVRRSMQLISETSTKLKKSFPGRDEQDYMAMTLIDFITTQTDKTTSSTTPISNNETTDAVLISKLKHISQLLDS